MRFINCVFLMLIFSSVSLLEAQTSDPILLKVNNETIHQSEFEYAYKKDSLNSINGKLSAEEFLPSFVNIKLNVAEAKVRGLDQRPTFLSEYKTYINQITQPFMEDSVSPEIVARKIYKRLGKNIEISRLSIRIGNHSALPKDTLQAYNKINDIRNLAIGKGQQSFEDLITKYSEDTIYTQSIRPGYMGWRTALTTPVTFEDLMYNTPVGEVSQPVRNGTEYNIIKVHRKRPDWGQINIAHILFRYPNAQPSKHEKDSVLALAEKVYNQLLDGADFNKLCIKYSFDKASAQHGGDLGWFSVHRPLPDVFETPLFALKTTGECTLPIEVEYGYHIFKLIERREFPSYEEIQLPLSKVTAESDYKSILLSEKINQLAKEYKYKINQPTFDKLEKLANQYSLSDSTYFIKAGSFINENILTIEKKSFTIREFINYLEVNSTSDYLLSTDILASKLNEYILHELENYKRNDIFRKNTSIRNLAQEFYDGILYFNIMNEEVWQKAQTDHATLETLFLENKDKYKWDVPKFKGLVIHAINNDVLKKVKALIATHKKEKHLEQAILNQFNIGDMKQIVIDKGLWAKGENVFVDKVIHKMKTKKEEIIGYPSYMVEGEILFSPQSLSDAFGAVVTDYQEKLEKEWIDKLRNKYKVEVFESTLRNMK